jgi:hypothetical protein
MPDGRTVGTLDVAVVVPLVGVRDDRAVVRVVTGTVVELGTGEGRPLLFVEQKDFVWGLIASMYLGNIVAVILVLLTVPIAWMPSSLTCWAPAGGAAAAEGGVAAVPEPATACGFALLAAGALIRRRRRNA